MDDSRPGNQKEITGEDLIIAFENLFQEIHKKNYKNQAWVVISNGNN